MGTFQYDANDNMASRDLDGPTTRVTYDADNRLVGRNRRDDHHVVCLRRPGRPREEELTQGATVLSETVYVGGLYEKDLVSGEITKYYQFKGGRVAMRKAGVLSYLLHDHLGSSSVALDASGGTVASQKYFPFGRPRNLSGPMPTDKLYTGHQQEGTLYFMQARFYDTLTGRFLSPDSVVPDPMDSQALNRYTYVYNNPLTYADPSGEFPCWGCGAARRVISSGYNYTRSFFTSTVPQVTMSAFGWSWGFVSDTSSAAYNWVESRSIQFGRGAANAASQTPGAVASGTRAAAGAAAQGTKTAAVATAKGVTTGATFVADAAVGCWDSTTCRTVVVTAGVIGCSAATSESGVGPAACSVAGTALLTYEDAIDCAGGSTSGCVTVGVTAGLEAASAGFGSKTGGLAREPHELKFQSLPHWRFAPLGYKGYRLPHYHRPEYDAAGNLIRRRLASAHSRKSVVN